MAVGTVSAMLLQKEQEIVQFREQSVRTLEAELAERSSELAGLQERVRCLSFPGILF